MKPGPYTAPGYCRNAVPIVGCEEVQDHTFAKPLPAAEIEDYLRSHTWVMTSGSVVRH